MMPAVESGKAFENAGLRVAEGVTGRGCDAGSEEGAQESDRGTGCCEGCEGTESDKGSKGKKSEKERRNIGNDDGGGLKTFFAYMPLVHVGRCFRLAVSLALLLGLAVAIIAPWAWVPVVISVVAYPISAAVFFLHFRRSGPRSGPPADMGPIGLGLVGASVALLAWDGTVLIGLILISFVIFLCGMSTGQWLVVVAKRRKTGFWGAIHAVHELEGTARKRAWLDLVEGRR